MSETDTKSEEKVDLASLEACTIEDIILDNTAHVSVPHKFKTNKGIEKTVRVTFRKLDMKEILILGKYKTDDEDIQAYQRHLLFLSSIEPKFNGLTEKDFKGVNWDFIKNYVELIQRQTGKNDFLLNELEN